MLDTKDLRSVIAHLTSDEGKEDLKGLGGVSAATAGVILRALSNLRQVEGKGVLVLPEEGDLDKPKLIRSKGVGVFFCTQCSTRCGHSPRRIRRR